MQVFAGSSGGSCSPGLGLYVAIECVDNPDIGSVSDTQTQGDDYVVIMTLEIDGKLYPRGQFTLGNPDACDGMHWHSPTPVYPIANASAPNQIATNEQLGLADPAPTVCGYGKSTEIPQRPVVATPEQWMEFQTNH